MLWDVIWLFLTCVNSVQVSFSPFNNWIIQHHKQNNRINVNSIKSNFLVQPPTPNPNGECPDKFQDLDSSSEYCYYISPDTDGKSWGDAHSECFAYEGTLASIHSEESNSRISDALRGRSKDVWIGLQADSKY